MTNHFISFPLKKKKKKKRRNYIEDTRTKTPSPSPRHSTPQHPPPNVINHPKKRKRPRAYLPLEKFGTRKWREAALPAARRHFEERVAMGGGRRRRTHADEQRAVRGRYTCVNAVWRTTEHCISAGNFATMHRTWITGGR